MKKYNIESFGKKWPERVVLCLYTIMVSLVATFHEPWYDEAQSYLIAKCASIYEMIFILPHYEGHTPLWWLLLVPFARSPIPYEIAISILNISLCVVTIYLILFKSPFPRSFRILLPFTYFYFYQYGVIARVYSLMMLSFSLIAVTFKNKDEKPFRFVFALILLSATGAFGIVLAFGIALVWLFDIWNRKNVLEFVLNSFRDRRIWALFILLLFAGCCVILIIPSSDTYATNREYFNNYIKSLIALLFIMPANVTSSDIIYGYGGVSVFNEMGIFELSSGIILGSIFISIYMVFLHGHKSLRYFVVPYIIFSFFFAFVYFYTHHQGIVFMFLIFCAWIAITEQEHFIMPDIIKRLINKQKDINALHKAGITMLCFCMSVSIYWNIMAIKNDYIYNYGVGRAVSDFIKKNNLENLNIMGTWREITNKHDGSRIQFTGGVDVIDEMPYFNYNLVSNLNYGDDKQRYMLHKIGNSEHDFSIWRETGVPDIILGSGYKMFNMVGYDNLPEYKLAETLKYNYIFKDKVYSLDYNIWMRSDKK